MDFSQIDIVNCLVSLGLKKGQTVFCHSNLGLFGKMTHCFTKEQYCESFYQAFSSVLTTSGTLVVPNFSYSFFKHEVYDPLQSNHTMGIFANYLSRKKIAKRTNDPCYSVSIIGKLQNQFLECSSSDTFGSKSIYGKLIAENGLIINLNMQASSTLIHYLEKRQRVDYRKDRIFKGKIIENGVLLEREQTIYTRSLDDPLDENNFSMFNSIADLSGLAKREILGRGYITSITARNVALIVEIGLTIDPFFLTNRGDVRNTQEIVDALKNHLDSEKN
jgi:aminoglycoside 3-N-acetyltransferase